jgi:hypothetical protein
MSANDTGTAEALCAKWMPRKKTTCARTPGHGAPCMMHRTRGTPFMENVQPPAAGVSVAHKAREKSAASPPETIWKNLNSATAPIQ